MKKWTAVDLDDYRGIEPSGGDMWSVVYLASDVDARVAELEKALRIALDHVDERETAREWFEAANRTLMESKA